MAKQFLANRSGQTPTLDEVPNETIKIYSTEAAADADLANLEENEIFATDEENNPASGTQYPVDVVQDGNMNAVTSNAVADAVSSIEEAISISSLYGGTITTTATTYTLDKKLSDYKLIVATGFDTALKARGSVVLSTTFITQGFSFPCYWNNGVVQITANYVDDTHISLSTGNASAINRCQIIGLLRS